MRQQIRLDPQRTENLHSLPHRRVRLPDRGILAGMDPQDGFSSWKVYAAFAGIIALFGVVYFDIIRTTAETHASVEVVQEQH